MLTTTELAVALAASQLAGKQPGRTTIGYFSRTEAIGTDTTLAQGVAGADVITGKPAAPTGLTRVAAATSYCYYPPFSKGYPQSTVGSCRQSGQPCHCTQVAVLR